MLDLGTRKGGAQRGSQPFPRFDRYRSPSRSGAALKRRVVVMMLVVLSLMLITIYFREAPTGGLHTAQDVGATVLRPFQVGAERVAQPFRDVYGWFSGLFHARSENERLRRELVEARRLAIQSRAALLENRELSAALEYRRQAAYPQDYEPVAAAVIAYPAQFGQSISIAAGSSDGVRLDDPVVSSSGDLVGRVTELSTRTAKVMLLTDGSSSVSAEDVETGARGVALAGRPGSGSLVLGLVKKRDVVNEGDTIITAGSEQGGRFGSFYPRDIPIGKVRFVSQADTDLYKRVQVDPFVDFDAIRSVQVLVRSERAP
jgi:rod shape-determining protein MreC